MKQSAVATSPQVTTRPHPILKCSRCGGRLFLSSEYQGRRLLYFWECSACSRQFQLSGDSVAHVGGVRYRQDGYNKRKMVGVV